jgi:hypothetical protein
VQPEAGTSGGVQSGNDQTNLCHGKRGKGRGRGERGEERGERGEGRGERGEGDQMQQPGDQRYKMVGLYRDKLPSPLG